MGDFSHLPRQGLLLLLDQHIVAELDALVADMDLRTGNDLLDLNVAATAERTARVAFGRPFAQNQLLGREITPRLLPPPQLEMGR